VHEIVAAIVFGSTVAFLIVVRVAVTAA